MQRTAELSHNLRLLKSIIFDLDGTLIHSAPDVRLALNHTLSTYGLAPVAQNEIYTLIGNGARAMIQGAFAKSHFKLNDEETQKALACYLKYYQSHPVVETTIYPGVIEILKQLKGAGIKLGICTNKPAVMAHIVLRHLKIDNLFDVILSGDEVSLPKPNGGHIHDVLKKMGLTDEPTVMVGDSKIDKACAANAGVSFIGVSYGYDLHPADSDIVINHFMELPDALLKTQTVQSNSLKYS